MFQLGPCVENRAGVIPMLYDILLDLVYNIGYMGREVRAVCREKTRPSITAVHVDIIQLKERMVGNWKGIILSRMFIKKSD